MALEIKYLLRHQVDDVRWDAAMYKAGNSLIYGYSYYLDKMSKHWSALILNDYEFIMPLAWNRKYGIYYLYQPYFTASLGIFGTGITTEIFNKFLDAIPRRFKYWDIYLNAHNLFKSDKYYLYERRNYVLDLNPEYDTLYHGYGKSHQRNIKRASQMGCTVETGIPVENVIRLSKEFTGAFSSVRESDYENFKSLYKLLVTKNAALTYGTFDTKKKLVSSCVYFFSKQRAYYILAGHHPDGRTMGASHLLIDQFIKDHAGNNLLLDFEGSDIRNLAWFYGSFGGKEEIYTALKVNRLPYPLKLFKQ